MKLSRCYCSAIATLLISAAPVPAFAQHEREGAHQMHGGSGAMVSSCSSTMTRNGPPMSRCARGWRTFALHSRRTTLPFMPARNQMRRMRPWPAGSSRR